METLENAGDILDTITIPFPTTKQSNEWTNIGPTVNLGLYDPLYFMGLCGKHANYYPLYKITNAINFQNIKGLSWKKTYFQSIIFR